jgi:hypothetical protein
LGSSLGKCGIRVYLSPATKKEDIPAAVIRGFERDRKVEPWSQLTYGYEVVDGDQTSSGAR